MVFKIKPALPKYKLTWDVGILITYISRIDTNSLKYLSHKLGTLLVLLFGQRCGEILSVLDIRDLDLSEDLCVIRIEEMLKTSGPKNHVSEIKLHADRNDLKIFPLNCLRQYLEAAKKHLKQYYFVIHNSEQTISRAIEISVSKMCKTNTQRC